MIELNLGDEQLAALHRRAALDGSTVRAVVAHGLEHYLALRDHLDGEPESCSEEWTPLYDGPPLTPDALHMQMALRRKA